MSSDDAQVDAHIIAVAPKISGNVIEVLVKDNQAVKAGDVLVRIDPRDYQARVDIARAAVLQAQSQLHTAQTVVPLTNDTTQSGTSGAAAQLADAMAELDRCPPGRTSRPRVPISPWPRPTCAPNRRATNAPRPIWRA